MVVVNALEREQLDEAVPKDERLGAQNGGAWAVVRYDHACADETRDG